MKQNEYGLSAWMAIVGVEILNEGGGSAIMSCNLTPQ